MKDFMILYRGHEGSSAIISHLKKSSNIDIVGFEPFDTHHMKKHLKGPDLARVFKLMFDKSVNFGYNKQIKDIYSQYTEIPINNIDKKKSVGFKIRLRAWPVIKNIIVKNNVVCFVLIRKNILKWAISRLRSNTLQFQLINKDITANPKLYVKIEDLDEKIRLCQKLLDDKQKLINALKADGVDVHPIYYEDYCNNKYKFFENVFNKLDIKMTNQELKKFAEIEVHFKKVHSNDIKDFIENYDEVLDYIKKNKLEKWL